MATVSEADPARERASAASFESFYRAEYAPVVRLAFVLTGRRDVAEELAQEGFLVCHQRWATVSTYDSPGAWVRRVSSGRRYLTELRLLARLGRERDAQPVLEPEGAELWAVVRSLPQRQAQVLALTFIEDLTVQDISRVLGIGEESVRTHLRRGRAAVAARLKEMSADG